MSHITDLLDHADRDHLTAPNAMRYNPRLPAASVPKPWRCLYCGVACDAKAWRGCCSALHAAWEHDTDNYDPED